MTEDELASRAAARLSGGYRVLCADPPWKFDDQLPGPGRGAVRHYPVMSLTDLCSFQIPQMAQDSYLLMWRCASMVEDAYEVVRAWNFVPKSEMVWIKQTTSGKRHFGMGHHVRAEHESVIIATRGNPKPLSHRVRSTFSAPVGRHSEKPEVFYDIVEVLAEGPYCELFGRRLRYGWRHSITRCRLTRIGVNSR